MKIIALIIAAGLGKRIGEKTRKQFILLNRKPVLFYTLEIFESCSLVDEILLVVPQKLIKFCQKEIIRKYNFTKIKKVISGGKKRQDSVYNGLKKIKHCDIVLIHDGVRPFITHYFLKKIIKSTLKFDAVIPALKTKETIKEVKKTQFVKYTLNRESLWLAQTPQGFKFELIIKAFKEAKRKKIIASDDASLVEKLGYPVKIIKGDENNIKITSPYDLKLAKKILDEKNEDSIK